MCSLLIRTHCAVSPLLLSSNGWISKSYAWGVHCGCTPEPTGYEPIRELFHVRLGAVSLRAFSSETSASKYWFPSSHSGSPRSCNRAVVRTHVHATDCSKLQYVGITSNSAPSTAEPATAPPLVSTNTVRLLDVDDDSRGAFGIGMAGDGSVLIPGVPPVDPKDICMKALIKVKQESGPYSENATGAGFQVGLLEHERFAHGCLGRLSSVLNAESRVICFSSSLRHCTPRLLASFALKPLT